MSIDIERLEHRLFVARCRAVIFQCANYSEVYAHLERLSADDPDRGEHRTVLRAKAETRRDRARRILVAAGGKDPFEFPGKVPRALALAADGLTPRHPRGVPSSARPFPLEVR